MRQERSMASTLLLSAAIAAAGVAVMGAVFGLAWLAIR